MEFPSLEKTHSEGALAKNEDVLEGNAGKA